MHTSALVRDERNLLDRGPEHQGRIELDERCGTRIECRAFGSRLAKPQVGLTRFRYRWRLSEAERVGGGFPRRRRERLGRKVAMSLHTTSSGAVPDDTASVAHAVVPQGNACLRLRYRLDPIFAGEEFATLSPKSGQPAECLWLALASLLHRSENLSDRRTADAVCSRID